VRWFVNLRGDSDASVAKCRVLKWHVAADLQQHRITAVDFKYMAFVTVILSEG
jgi:hypothetical protein